MKDNGENSSPMVNENEVLNRPCVGSIDVSLNQSEIEDPRDVNDTPVNQGLDEVSFCSF